MFVLNGRKFGLLLSREERKNSFRIEVYEGENPKDRTKNLLDTEVVLEEQNTAIFGFENPDGNIYFLSLHREMDTEVVEEDEILVSTQYRPRLIHWLRPQYPEEALKKGVEGWVRLQGGIDNKGQVAYVNVISGPRLLKTAAVAAVKQWQYRPPKPEIKDGQLPVPFTAVIIFRLPKDKQKEELAKTGTKDPAPAAVPDIWPTRGYISLAFGPARSPFTLKEMFHNGLDIAAKAGTPVAAPADGLVTTAGFKGDYGYLIIIDHRNGYTTWYAHLQAVKVRKGEQVKRGETIGFVGNSGKSMGPHLHYEVRLNDKPVNPVDLIEER